MANKTISNFHNKMVEVFSRIFTFQKTNISHQTGKGKSWTQNSLGMGYFSSQKRRACFFFRGCFGVRILKSTLMGGGEMFAGIPMAFMRIGKTTYSFPF